MGEFEDRINSVLSDPGQMEKIANLAKSFMAGGGEKQAESPAEDTSAGIFDAVPDPKLLGRISRLIQNGGGEKKQERALLEAMLPYMSEKRRSKMTTAIKIARIAGIARAAMGEMGDEGGD